MRVLVADDHDLLRDTVILFLNGLDGLEALPAKDLPQTLELIRKTGPFDLVLLDFGMPGMNGLTGLQVVLAEPKTTQVALMSGIAPREVAEAALAMGAAGFLPKTLPAKSMANAVRFMAMGEKYAPIDFMTAPQDPLPVHPLSDVLSKREMEVFDGLCKGKSNKEIARDLRLMEPTVKLHVRTLYRKIGAQNRTQAVIYAKEAGLF